MQLSFQEAANNGGDKLRRNQRRGYLVLCTDLEEGKCLAIFSD